ncbi:hypothetical protein CBP31_02300 [Oceanisphaera profunda]|uniref:Uncharacterized protein n=1 Tax=Oceanisphaera profunda TaxID=1416627 RepID=A0A1Y0D2P5_9GAMM|nr:DUF4144 family protein [Oceanisphaera profunda]ART81604.1 hypothetical protein CBP31_02300 [Oceanisphaera profunda]
MIHWPALVSSEQGADYACVAEFNALEDQRLWPGCRLVDSEGWVYLLSQASDGDLYWHRQPELVSLLELNHELKRYAANLGVCCTGKLAIRTLAEAFALVEWLEQQ